jgi:hypothetical protein
MARLKEHDKGTARCKWRMTLSGMTVVIPGILTAFPAGLGKTERDRQGMEWPACLVR